jgi:hypothetical protein
MPVCRDFSTSTVSLRFLGFRRVSACLTSEDAWRHRSCIFDVDPPRTLILKPADAHQDRDSSQPAGTVSDVPTLAIADPRGRRAAGLERLREPLPGGARPNAIDRGPVDGFRPPHWMTLDHEDIEAIAERLVERLAPLVAAPTALPDWMTLAQKARQLSVHPTTVYRNARRLGGRKVSPGKTAAWRFPPDSTLPEDSVGPASSSAPQRNGTRNRPRQRANPQADSGLLRSRPRM